MRRCLITPASCAASPGTSPARWTPGSVGARMSGPPPPSHNWSRKESWKPCTSPTRRRGGLFLRRIERGPPRGGRRRLAAVSPAGEVGAVCRRHPRQHVTAWRWEVELLPGTRPAHVRRFTFTGRAPACRTMSPHLPIRVAARCGERGFAASVVSPGAARRARRAGAGQRPRVALAPQRELRQVEQRQLRAAGALVVTDLARPPGRRHRPAALSRRRRSPVQPAAAASPPKIDRIPLWSIGRGSVTASRNRCL